MFTTSTLNLHQSIFDTQFQSQISRNLGVGIPIKSQSNLRTSWAMLVQPRILAIQANHAQVCHQITACIIHSHTWLGLKTACSCSSPKLKIYIELAIFNAQNLALVFDFQNIQFAPKNGT